MLSQKTKNNFEKTNALKEKSSTKNENKQKNGEEFMQNQAKKNSNCLWDYLFVNVVVLKKAALSCKEICIQCGGEFVPPDGSRAHLKLLRKMLQKKALLELCHLCLWNREVPTKETIRETAANFNHIWTIYELCQWSMPWDLRYRIKHLANCERQASVDGKISQKHYHQSNLTPQINDLSAVRRCVSPEMCA